VVGGGVNRSFSTNIEQDLRNRLYKLRGNRESKILGGIPATRIDKTYSGYNNYTIHSYSRSNIYIFKFNS